MTQPAQLLLDLERSPAHGSGDYLVAACNREAVGWLFRDVWPARGIVLYGPAGSGKSHLSEVWRLRQDGLRLSPEDLSIEGLADRLGTASSVTVDEPDRLAGDRVRERGLLHLHNLLAGVRGRLLLTSRHPPKDWGMVLPDLRSRIMALPAVEIGLPDDSMLAAILVKLFDDRQVTVEAPLITYLLSRMERTFESALRLVRLLDEASLRRRSPINQQLVRDILAQLKEEE